MSSAKWRKSWALIKITVVGAVATTEALRGPCDRAPSSPKTSPGPRSATCTPSRSTSTAPRSIAKNSNGNRPSSSSCSPAATSTGSAHSATRRSSSLWSSPNNGIDLSRRLSTSGDPILAVVSESAVVRATLFTDPGCPWAYSARPALARVRWRFGDQLDWRLVLIGLSENTDRYVAMGYNPARQAASWATFQRRFGMPFALMVKPRLAPTTRACRAIIAAREAAPALGEAALFALHLLHFTTTGLLDDDESLRAALAQVDGLDADAVVASIDDSAIVSLYESDKALARSAEGTPIHVQDRHSTSDGPVRYTAPSVIFEHRDGRRVDVGGFQPFESYDNALANLDTSLERRAAPADPLEALAEFPHGLTTAEVASITRASDLAEEDHGAAKHELLALADDGAVVCEPTGADALWRARSGNLQ